MKKAIMVSTGAECNDPDQQKTLQLSNEAFYLIVLAAILKKMIRPASMQQFLAPGNSIGFNDEPVE